MVVTYFLAIQAGTEACNTVCAVHFGLFEVKHAIKWYKSTNWNRFMRLSQWFPYYESRPKRECDFVENKKIGRAEEIKT